MTFCATQEVLESLHGSLQAGERWCEEIEEQSNQDPEFDKVAHVIRDEIRTRRINVEDQMRFIQEGVGATRLQYAKPEEIRNATHQLTEKHPNNPSDLRRAVADFYDALRDELDTCVQSAANTRASKVVNELHQDIETGIANVIWNTRPDQEQEEIDDVERSTATATAATKRKDARDDSHASPSVSLSQKAQHLMQPDYPQLDSKHRWLPFSVVVLIYFFVLAAALIFLVGFVF